jgi:hypothetical protein
VDLEIRWPNGAKQAFQKLELNRLLIIREGSATVERAPWPSTKSA